MAVTTGLTDEDQLVDAGVLERAQDLQLSFDRVDRVDWLGGLRGLEGGLGVNQIPDLLA